MVHRLSANIRDAYFSILLTVVLSLLLIVQVSGQIELGSPFITNYSSADYLTYGKNWAIANGQDGRMYFANNYGLIQFDGYEWQRIGQPINQSELRSFLVKDNRIYIGGTSEIGFFQKDALGVFNYQKIDPPDRQSPFLFNDVINIATFQDHVFFLTENGIMMYQDSTLKILGESLPFKAYATGREELVFAANDHGLFRFEADSLVQISPLDALKGVGIQFLLLIDDHTYLIGTDTKGVFKFESGMLSVWNPTENAFFLNNNLVHGTILNKNLLIFGSIHNGLILTDYEGNVKNVINEDDGLLDQNILSLHKDPQGNIWTAVDGSISYIELSNPFTLLNKKNGLRGEIFTILFQEDYLYVGTSRGLYAAKWKVNLEFELIPNTTGQCWKLFEHQGHILLGHHNGFFVIEGQQASYIGGNGHWNFVPIPGEDNLLLSGHYSGISLIEYKEGRYQLKGDIKGFKETAREILWNKDKIWVSHGYKGIYQLQLGPQRDTFDFVRLFTTEDGLPSNLYNSLLDVDRQVLFGTQQGVYEYNSNLDEIEPQAFFQELLGKETLVRKLVKSPNGNYLAVKNYDRNDEVFLVEVLEDGSYTHRYDPFQKLKGQLIPAFESFSFKGEEQIFFGAKPGLIIYNAQLDAKLPKDHQCFVSEIRLPYMEEGGGNSNNQNPLPTEFSILLNEVLSFRFSSSFYESVPFTQFSTYLEGFDKEWQAWSSDNFRDFKNLKAGSYTFWVKAKNIYGVESPTFSHAFVIKRSLSMDFATLKRPVFFIVLGLGICIAYFFFARRLKRLKLTLNQNKQNLDELQTNENAWNKEKEELNQKLSIALLENEIHSGLIQKIESLGDKEKTAPEVKKIIETFNNNLKEVHLHIEARKELEADDFISKIQKQYPALSPRELRLCSYLKLNVSSKEIAEYLGISVRGVESLRYRIRKKLGLKKGEDLTAFILNI